ncbi:MAG: hypothetical protein II054_06865, partial [Treponema sp.]|nr:hypothetical protein [Treponema sp.]
MESGGNYTCVSTGVVRVYESVLQMKRMSQKNKGQRNSHPSLENQSYDVIETLINASRINQRFPR